jgi:erythromycin esterase-like protein
MRAIHDASELRPLAIPLRGTEADFDAVVAAARDKRYVLIGEASHGTHEFYRSRAEITKRLIRDHGFCAVAIEGDWPDAYRVHRYVCGTSTQDQGPADALGGFKRFPTWMWRNADVLEFVAWLHAYNRDLPPAARVGFYGLDLYSMFASIQAVVEYLERVDPEAAERAKERYACFDRFGTDTESYAYAVGSGLTSSCRRDVLEQLLEMQRAALAPNASDLEDERRFVAEQNARVVASAEEYYRTMLDAEVSSWNQRDTFMFGTLKRLSAHRERRDAGPAKIVVWAHNSHVGDARATTLGGGRELNVGQLVRQEYPLTCYSLGFTTSSGTVTAASNWHEHAERKVVRPPLPGSWEALFHAVGISRFFLDLKEAAFQCDVLRGRLLERAIGVIYRPETEFYSHYFEARISEQFDAIIHYDATRAVQPLEPGAVWQTGEAPETFPSGV